ILAAVLIREPDLNGLPPYLNPRILELLRRSLEKNPKRRWQAVGDLRAELEVVASSPRIAPAKETTSWQKPPLWKRASSLQQSCSVSLRAPRDGCCGGRFRPQW